MNRPRVSIITSVCRARDFIEGLLENIVSQTSFDKCELIMVQLDNKFCQDTENIIKKYQEKYPNILYSRMKEDPGIYAVWNHCIQNASGDFVTNWNCDDRRQPDSLQKQIIFFDKNPDVDLLYNDQYYSGIPNWMPWEDKSVVSPVDHFYGQVTEREQYSLASMVHNLMHNDPIWRIGLHERFGYFREDTITCADHEFWLRCAINGSMFAKIEDITGVYYRNPIGISSDRRGHRARCRQRMQIIGPLIKIIQEMTMRGEHNMKKRAFLIVASGNTGCRLFTGLFLQSGCWGDRVGDEDGWASRLDKGIWPKNGEHIVWRTHNYEDEETVGGNAGATSIYRMVDQCVEKGYEPTIITVYRDIPITSYGAVKRGHRIPPLKNGQALNRVETRQEEKKIQSKLIENYARTFSVLEEMKNRGHQVFAIDFAAFTRNPILYTRMISAEICFLLNDMYVNGRADLDHYGRFN
tara:strand:+ start:368 stop:1765 length:1398 start_codon:yes stop_codon:yes gene_type:complete